ncbi:MAG: transposase, partial [Clostridiales bacterium]|nr:transposase [Clostridiales bacterium]
TSNGIERGNEEIRRRDRTIRVYLSDDSVMRIIGTILLEQNAARRTAKSYFDRTEYRERLEDEKKAALSASMRAASELPREEEAAENCADVRAA